jgi:putative transposase
MDWMHDELFDGRRIWVRTIVDTWSRLCPVMRVCRSATAMEVIGALEEARERVGLPHTIRRALVHEPRRRAAKMRRLA